MGLFQVDLGCLWPNLYSRDNEYDLDYIPLYMILMDRKTWIEKRGSKKSCEDIAVLLLFVLFVWFKTQMNFDPS